MRPCPAHQRLFTVACFALMSLVLSARAGLNQGYHGSQDMFVLKLCWQRAINLHAGTDRLALHVSYYDYILDLTEGLVFQ